MDEVFSPMSVIIGNHTPVLTVMLLYQSLQIITLQMCERECECECECVCVCVCVCVHLCTFVRRGRYVR